MLEFSLKSGLKNSDKKMGIYKITKGQPLRQWVKKLVDQFDMEWESKNQGQPKKEMPEELATILYIIDIYNKHLFEVDSHPVRKVRAILDEFVKRFVGQTSHEQFEKTLFRFRQFFSSYRIAEFSYIQKTFEDFKGIIWDFADQLNEEAKYEKIYEQEMRQNLNLLKEAVDANSIDDLRTKAREFIDMYVESQYRKDQFRQKKMSSMEKNLGTLKKQLAEVNQNLRVDHLTQAYNRMSFDEHIKKLHRLHEFSKTPMSMISVDIDFFKKINDSYGHDIGDYILKECVRSLKEIFHRPCDFVARVGGEEFVILISDCSVAEAIKKAEETLEKTRKEVFVHDKLEITFTVSMGIAELALGESISDWTKRADQALYNSKQFGRNRYTVAPVGTVKVVA